MPFSMPEPLKRTRIKVCGMTDVKVARVAVGLGVDAIGMILHADSPRRIDLERARAIRAEIPAFVSLVGVFVDCPPQDLNSIADQVGLDLVQLHGAETNEYAESLNRPFIKAVRAKEPDQVNRDVQAFPNARAILLDPFVEGQHGGTGRQLSTHLWPTNDAQDLILAGGLSANNVGVAIAQLNPFAVDFNSGLETMPGKKDLGLLAQAIQAVAGVKR